MTIPMFESHLPFPKRRGKVRDVYDVSDVLGSPMLLIVASDRISAFDCVMSQPIPGKGKLLTQLSNHWFSLFAADFANHLIHADSLNFPEIFSPFEFQLAGRSVLAIKTRVIPFECVARGYLAGSGWKEYRNLKQVCGINLPDGLLLGSKLNEPIFTPATKAESGHDQNVTFEEMCRQIGTEQASELRRMTLDLYARAAAHAAAQGLIIADTKFEFGIDESGRVIVIDEILTPDSSRFWPLDLYQPGREQPSFDKQLLRDYLEQVAWDKSPPPPALPADLIDATRQKYIEAYETITGQIFVD